MAKWSRGPWGSFPCSSESSGGIREMWSRGRAWESGNRWLGDRLEMPRWATEAAGGAWEFISESNEVARYKDNVQKQIVFVILAIIRKWIRFRKLKKKKDDLANINVDWKESEKKEYILCDLHRAQTQAKKEMATHSRTIAWKIPRTEEPGRLLSMGSQRVGHDWVTSLHFKCRQK